MTTSAGLQKEIVSGFGLAAGIYSIVHGLLAKKFAFRSKAWKPGEEKVEFEPSWKDRLLIVFVGVCVAVVSLYSLVGLTRQH
jgi:hypothetical protein